jgi:hypothetical protein
MIILENNEWFLLLQIELEIESLLWNWDLPTFISLIIGSISVHFDSMLL